MKNQDLHYQSASDLIALLANKKISATELLEETIARIELLDKKINAVVVRDFENARITAKTADQAIARNERLPLLGLPITVKESFDIAGLPTTWGNMHFKNWCPQEDALAIVRLKKAGAIIIGKTNISTMLQDWQSYNEIYGTTNNPWDLNRTPGGSSGGSAASVAAGFVALELGSDLGGSVRVPAHFCGIFGHKSSLNLIPLRGSSPPTAPRIASPVDLVVAGPIARTADDLVLGLNVMAGPDDLWDRKGYQLCLPPARHTKLSDFRVLIIDEHPLCPTAHSIKHAINNLIEHLNKSKVSISRDIKNMPDLAEIARTYALMFFALVSANMPIAEFETVVAAEKALDKNDNSFIAALLRGSALSYRDWFAVSRRRNELRQQWRNLFKEFDVVICPVMPTPAFPHNHTNSENRQLDVDGLSVPYLHQFAWSTIASLFGFPSTVVPIGHSENNLPIGVQVIGDYLEDYTTIKFASLLECEWGGFSPPPL